SITHLLRHHLKAEGQEEHLTLALPAILGQVDTLSPATLELAALSTGLQTTQVGFPWTDTLALIPPATADVLTPILQNFLTKYPYLPLPPYNFEPEDSLSIPEPPIRTLLIPLEIPALPLLFSANIALLPPYDTKPILPTGDALPARVHLSVSTEWANPPPKAGQKWRVVWEVGPNTAGEWLVGGVRRGRAMFGPFEEDGEGGGEG